MLLTSLASKKILPRLAGRRTRIGDVLRFNSSSPLSPVDLQDPPPHTPSQLFPSPTISSTHPPPLLPSKTATKTSPSLSSPLQPLQRRSQPRRRPPKNSFLLRTPRSPPISSSGVRITSSTLLNLLRDREENPSSPPPYSADLVAVDAGKGSLEVTGTREEVEEFPRRLMEAASSLEEGVDVAGWILRVTEEGPRDKGVRMLVYAVINALLFHLGSFQPRPPPDLLLRFLRINQPRLRLTFNPTQNPLINLLEVYARLYTQDRRRLDPSAAAPPPDVVAELETLRLHHLDAVRAIHQAMKEVDKDVFTVRCYTSLMEAYDKGKSFEDVEEMWTSMRSEGGVGIDHRAVSVYFDSCGFSGSLSRALAAWKDLRTSGFELSENNHHASQECLNRCGAWDELLVFLSDQQAQHLVDSSTTPPLTAPMLASTIKLANRMVYQPRHRSLRQVDREDFKRLRSAIKGLVPRKTWGETETILSTKGRHVVDGGVKTGTGNGRRPDRERPQ